MSLSVLVWRAAGRPTIDACESYGGTCWYCGAASCERGQPVAKWAGSGFNSYDRAQSRTNVRATHVCEACVFVCSRISPVPGRGPNPATVEARIKRTVDKARAKAEKAGKSQAEIDAAVAEAEAKAKAKPALGGNYRNYSHAAEDLGDTVHYVNANKAEAQVLVDWLRDEGQRGPWAMAIAESGQKHVIFRAPMNPPGQRVVQVAFEERVIRFPRTSLIDLREEMNELRRASKCSADAIKTGNYHPKDLDRALEAVRKFEADHRRQRGSDIFQLAAFLTTKGSK